jgi:hypothetical protein
VRKTGETNQAPCLDRAPPPIGHVNQGLENIWETGHQRLEETRKRDKCQYSVTGITLQMRLSRQWTSERGHRTFLKDALPGPVTI